MGTLLKPRAFLVLFIALTVSSVAEANSLPAKSKPGCLSSWLESLFGERPEVRSVTSAEALKILHERYRETWSARHAQKPEDTVGLTTEQALALLDKLRSQPEPTGGGRQVRNQTYFVKLDATNSAVVKRDARRSEYSFDTGRSYLIQNRVRYDVLAFKIDRFLGTNQVPPAVSLGDGICAELFIKGVQEDFSVAKTDASVHMDISHTRILDFLLANIDRQMPGNLMKAYSGKVITIDFDLAKINPSHNPVGAVRYFETAKLNLKEENMKLATGQDIPPVFSRRVVEQLRKFDKKVLTDMAEEGGITITPQEMDYILQSKQGIVEMVDHFISIYGESQILVD